MLDIKELLKLSAYLEPATISSPQKEHIQYPRLNVRLTKENYYYIEQTLTGLIDSYKKLKQHHELVLPAKKELTDIKIRNSVYENGNYIIKTTQPQSALTAIIKQYTQELKNAQDSYRYLIS